MFSIFVSGITPAELDFKSLIGVFVGASVSLFLLLCIVLVIKIRCRSSKKPKKENGDLNGPTIDNIEKDPDVIPHNEGKLNFEI